MAAQPPRQEARWERLVPITDGIIFERLGMSPEYSQPSIISSLWFYHPRVYLNLFLNLTAFSEYTTPQDHNSLNLLPAVKIVSSFYGS